MHSFVITVQRRVGDTWPVVAETSAGGDSLPVRGETSLRFESLPATTPETVHAHLVGLFARPRAYGEALGRALFRDAVRDAFASALARSPEQLHVLLFVEDPELQSLRWERLCGPFDGGWQFLALEQRTPF